MTNIEQGLWRLSKYRYSIKQLLALSDSSCASFDLSKFSFDAARAGVIPPLGDCAAYSRRSSATRPRYSSGESVNAAADPTMAAGKDTALPERRPQPPPVNMLAQHHAGFARFLKKHISPTHQRVTAGGRIVPMGPQHPPPTFTLPVYQPVKVSEAVYTDEPARPDERETFQNIPERASGTETLQVEDAPFTDQSNGACYGKQALTNHEWTSDGFKSLYQPASQSSNARGYCMQAPSVHTAAARASFVPNISQSYGPWSAMCAHPNAMMVPSMNPWLYGDGTMTASTPVSSGTTGHFNQPIVWAQNAFSEWSQRYYELDQQLKALDRHRAMTNLTADIANQRREIVQQRSDSKNMMNLITAWLDLSEKVHPDAHCHSSDRVFDARAPAYVPMTEYATRSSDQTLCGEKANECTIQKPPPRSARRPIPIVPPPKLQNDVDPNTEHDRPSPDSPTQLGVDAWGVNLGPAPPELKKQQNEVLESISEAHSRSSHSNRSQESLRSAPQGGFFQQDLKGSQCSNTMGQSHDGNSHASAEPVSRLEMTRKMTVTGGLSEAYVNVDRPIPSVVNTTSRLDFKKNYWSQNSKSLPLATEIIEDFGPETVQQKSGTGIEHRTRQMSHCTHKYMGGSVIGGDKENFAAMLTMHRKAATDSAFTHSDDSQLQNDVDLYRTQFAQDYNAPTPVIARRDPASVRDDHSGQSQFDTSELMYHNKARLEDCEGAVDPSVLVGQPKDRLHYSYRDPTTSSSHDSTELLNNKAYSSILVQNVNAVARLPQNLDGTTDGERSSKSILALAGKIKSPRLLRRTTANGGA